VEKFRLGRTGLMVTRTAFGVLPLQRVPMDEAVKILRKAYDYGINFYDTANSYTDSEEKIGNAFAGRQRQNIVIATKSGASDKQTVTKHIELSLKHLKTDYIDLFQFHNPGVIPDPNDPDGAFAAALEAKRKGYIRHIGLTNHRFAVAKQAVESGNFETLQFPFSYLAAESETALVRQCAELDIGFIAMKGLSGGLLTNARACAAFMRQYPNVATIWGIQREEELDEWVRLDGEDLALTEDLRALIDRDRAELAGSFCRGCGYCMPCPVGIEINNAARMNMLLRRSPYQRLITEEYYKQMHLIDNCLGCGQCKGRCPYGLNTPELLKAMLKDYDEFYDEHH